MARIYPEIADPNDIEHDSERLVYIAIRDDLPDEYVALHSYPWLRPWRGKTKDRSKRALLEGEADFVLFHPERGMLVLEVKGGDTIHVDGEQWFRRTATGDHEFQNPFAQARRNMHALLDLAKERTEGRVRKGQFVHGYAAVFPHGNYSGGVPADADPAIIICKQNFPTFQEAVEHAYERWTDKPLPLPPEDYRLLLHEALMPKFRVFRPAGPLIAHAEEQLLELTETQAEVFEGLYGQERVLVRGIAGSGKTILALNRALAFARAGQRTLFVCFNSDLAEWLAARVAEDASHEAYREQIVISHFHRFARDLTARADVAFQPEGGGRITQRFWDKDVPDLMEQAVFELESKGEKVRFDALVIDEAQDFSRSWWFALLDSLTNDREATPVYAFMDPNQSLRGEVESPPIKFQSEFDLKLNCRNTKKIARASASVLDLESREFKRAPLGDSPRLTRAKSAHQASGLVVEEVRRLLKNDELAPQQIALIGPAAKSKSTLSDVDEVDGVKLVTDAELWRRGGGVLVTTARSFKGLEADAVLIYDLGGFSDLFTRADLYVACTRAKHVLVALSYDGATREVLDHAISAAEATK